MTTKTVTSTALSLALALLLGACGGNVAGGAAGASQGQPKEPVETVAATAASGSADEQKGEGAVAHDAYVSAAEGDAVSIEAYVQAKLGWADGKASLYAQDADGGYFINGAACTKEAYDALQVGQKIRVAGSRTEASDGIALADGASVEVLEGSFVANPVVVDDPTNMDLMRAYQNQKVAIAGMTVAPSLNAEGAEVPFLYKRDGSGAAGKNDDLYFNVTYGDCSYGFMVESALCPEDSEAYKAVTGLKVGDVVDLEGFLSWYESPCLQVTKVTVK